VDSLESFGRILGSQQVTDAYLLALARRHNAVFVTFDTRLRAVAGPDAAMDILG
jgi:predicted nucleic acid-binding protein